MIGVEKRNGKETILSECKPDTGLLRGRLVECLLRSTVTLVRFFVQNANAFIAPRSHLSRPPDCSAVT